MTSAEPAVDVLLVEDGEDDAELARRALGLDAARVVRVRDGAEALDYLLRRGAWDGRCGPDPRLVLLDLKMPRVDGAEVLAAAKSDPRTRAIPIVVLSSSAQERDVARCYALGANGYVVKPVDYAAFKTAVAGTRAFWLGVNQPPRSGAPRPRPPAA